VIKKNIATLQAEGKIKRVGPDKGGYWEVVD
jgi:predicted HTH transcriptional regulator